MDMEFMRLHSPTLRAAGRRLPARPRARCAPSPRILLLIAAYALLLGAAELLAAAVQATLPLLGAACYGAVLLLLSGHAVLYWGQSRRYVPLVAASAPAARLLLILIPGGGAPLWRGLTLGVPLLLAGLVALPLAGFPPERVRTWLVGAAAQCRHTLTAPWWRPPPWAGHRLPAGVLSPAAMARSWAASLRCRATALGRRALILPAITLFLALFASVWVAHAASPRQVPLEALPAAAGAASAVERGSPSTETQPLLAASRFALGTEEKQAPAVPAAILARRGLLRRGPAGRSMTYAGHTLPTLSADDLAALTAVAAPAAAEGPLYPDCPSLGLWNPYPRGVCTWYAKDRRPDLPGFVNDWGLAIHWPTAAELCGFRVDSVPRAGAVIVFPPGANGAYWGGHVGYVEQVQPGALLISECNADQDSAFAVSPHWWEAGYSCTFRRIPWETLSSAVVYIHGYQEPAGPPTRWSPTPRDGVDEAAGAAPECTP
jgi:surface antigen